MGMTDSSSLVRKADGPQGQLPHTNPLAGLERFRQVVERPDLPHRHIILAGNLPERVASANGVVSSLCRIARLGEGPALNRHLVCDARHALDARRHAFGRAVLLARLYVAAQREVSRTTAEAKLKGRSDWVRTRACLTRAATPASSNR